VGVHPSPSPAWANFSIMMECTAESDRCHSVCVLCGESLIMKGVQFCLKRAYGVQFSAQCALYSIYTERAH
jgi:hypothetical protein